MLVLRACIWVAALFLLPGSQLTSSWGEEEGVAPLLGVGLARTRTVPLSRVTADALPPFAFSAFVLAIFARFLVVG